MIGSAIRSRCWLGRWAALTGASLSGMILAVALSLGGDGLGLNLVVVAGCRRLLGLGNGGYERG